MKGRDIVRQFMAEKGVGRDLVERSMHQPFPALRRELAQRLLAAGLSTVETGRALGIHHSAVILMFSPRREEKLARMRYYSRLRKKWI